MTISEQIEQFMGFPVKDYFMGKGVEAPERTVYRLSMIDEGGFKNDEFAPYFEKFLNEPGIDTTPGLVIGPWFSQYESYSSEEVVELLVRAADRLKGLRGIFIGEMTYEECEISWIEQSDVSPVLQAYPKLEHFQVRGGTGLGLERCDHQNLKALIVETGGLDVSVVKQIFRAKLPSLEHLELWLGIENYGASVCMADLPPLLSGDLFPNLVSLGLRDSDLTDKIAVALTQTTLIKRLKRLDLSLGTLTDKGGRALLESEDINKLEVLDLHYHFLSEDMAQKLAALDPAVDVSDRQDDQDDDRYPAVTE